MRERSHPAPPTMGLAIAWLLVLCASCGGQPPHTPTPTPTFLHPSPSSTFTATTTLAPSPTPSPTPEVFAGKIPILEYHYTTYHDGDVQMTTEWFQSQMRWLAENGYTTISAEQLAAFLGGKNIPVKSVALTFDVGTAERADYLEQIIPALKEYHFHALFFVVTNMINDSCGVDNKICWEELRGWADQGLISVESHGVYHPDYTAISTAEQRRDSGTSRQLIAEKTGRTPIGFAYPYDSYNEGAVRVVESIGYQFALAGNTRTDRAIHLGDTDRFHLPRVYPYSNPRIYPAIYGTSGKTFAQLISGYSAPLATVVPLPQESPSGTMTIPAAATDPGAYARSCAKINQMQNPQDRQSALWNLTLSTDISVDTQSILTRPVILKPSCNVILGNNPRGIVLHATRGTLTAAINEFQHPGNTSAHYIIDRDGQIYQMVPERLGAFHASCAGRRTVCLASCPLCEKSDGTFLEPYLQSIGIELVNDGQLVDPSSYKGLTYEDYLMSFGYRYWEDYPEAQLQALILLVSDIRARWGIPLDLVVGHYRINNNTDPGPALNISWYRIGDPPRAPIFTE
jgi:peptidoglycan/xylan/chitin deacetylase (PgdA/CDA1 family)/N-acetyl-anhydromuramyl-L-alanine amidase AmpD